MCLNCGCGEINKNHGDPMNLTMNRLRLMSIRTGKTVEELAANIAATVFKKIAYDKPLRGDTILLKITRVPPKMGSQWIDKVKEEAKEEPFRQLSESSKYRKDEEEYMKRVKELNDKRSNEEA